MKKNWLHRMAFLGLLLAVLVFTLAAQGTQDDPLVTLGYLTDRFMPQVMEQVKAQTEDRQETLEKTLQEQIEDYTKEITKKINKLSGSSSERSEAVGFAVVTVDAGCTLRPEPGCEIVLRSGNAVCVATALPGLVDVTSGGELSGNSPLERNHLYLATDSDRGVLANDTVTLLVRGAYTIA